MADTAADVDALGNQLVRASVGQDFGASDEELGRHVLRFPHESSLSLTAPAYTSV